MNPRRLLALIAGVAVVADQITKAVALSALNDGESIPVVDGVLHWTLQRNPGAAFGLFRPPGPFRGRVIDFIDFRIWPTFNLADVMVVAGAALLAIASFRADRRDPARQSP